MLLISYIMDTADFVNIIFVERLKANSTLSFLNQVMKVRRMGGSRRSLVGLGSWVSWEGTWH